jgi:hypothetical protein
MYVATTALSTAARMISLGWEDRTSSHPMASSAASTMKLAFMMLLQAMMRAMARYCAAGSARTAAR